MFTCLFLIIPYWTFRVLLLRQYSMHLQLIGSYVFIYFIINLLKHILQLNSQ